MFPKKLYHDRTTSEGIRGTEIEGGRLGLSLVRLGYTKEDTLLSFLSVQYRVPSVKLSKLEINPNVIELIPSSIIKKHFIIPIHRVGTKLTLAMVDPSNVSVTGEVEFLTGFNVEPVVASETEIIDAIKKYYGGGGGIARLGIMSFQATDYSLDEEKGPFDENGLILDDDSVNVKDFNALVHGAVDMVGEIRDFETAQIAVQAALTGHLVLSTVHTNDAPGTITRLIDMGIEPFLITSALILILAQRLIRKICMDCREPIKVHPQLLIDLDVPPDEVKSFPVYKGKGFPICNNTGYKGRIGLYEVMPLKEEIKELILSRSSTTEIKKEAIRLRIKTLRQSGISKIKQGLTTVEEIVRTTMEDR